ncbi:MAG TPA: fibronectin type III domain-containing protein, partial [Acidimicrobiales bacterium]|nr:fibronectin type III domain-containing protein [Acidimicrobiales bacterium]
MRRPRGVHRVAVLAGVLVGVGLAGAGAAFAYFAYTDAANAAGARAVAATLSAPSAPTATANGGGSVTVGWTLPSSQLSGAQYQVTRTAGPGAPSTVCTVSAVATSCVDTGLTPGSVYGYSIAALLGGWQSGAVVASTTTSVPTLSLTLSAGPYAAGTPVTVTQVQAKLGGSVDTSMSGTVPITWSGLASSPTGVAPTYPAGPVTFTNGVATPSAAFTPSDAVASTLTATDAAAPGTTGSASFTVAPGTASKLHVTAQPSGANGGAAFTAQPAVAVDDADGNVVTSDASSVTLSIAAGTPTSGGPGALSGCASGESLGVFTFAGCQITTAGSGYELTATDGSLTPATTAAFDVTVGPAAQLAIRAQPAGASGGSAFSTQPQVAIEDAGGNVVTSDASTVTLSIATGTPTSGGPGTLSGCSPTETSGVVVFTGCAISTTGTGYRLTASDGALSAASTTAFNVVAGPATQLAFTQTPGASTGGTTFAVQPRVSLLDAGGNVASGSSSSITLAIATGTGTLACTSNPVGTSSGVATFAGCKITLGTDGSFSLRASASGYTSITSATFTVYGAATKLVFTTQPTNSTGGSALGTQPVVAVEDAASNVVPSSSAAVTLSVSTGAGTLACTANPLSATAGVASFGGCTITLGTQGTFKLSATSSGLTTVTSAAFTVAGAATKLVLTTQPTASTGGAALTTQPVVAVEDSSGDVVTASSAPVALAIASGSGTLACGTNPLTPTSGVAAFAGCAISLGTEGSFTLSATSSGLTSATSSSFTVAGAATKLAFTTQPSTATGGSPFSSQPVVKVEDGAGDVVTTSSAPVTLAIASGSGTLACTSNPVTSSSGVAIFAGCAITLGTQGSFTLSAASTGLTTATSSSFTVAGSAAKLVLTTQPSNASSGTAFSTQPVVKVEDTSGDVVTTSSAPVTLSIATGTGTLACTTNPVTSSSGVATFAGCAITLGTPGSFTLSAASSGLSSATSASFTVAGAATKLAFTTQPST